MINRKVSVLGLGYVGLPVAVAFGKYQQVIGFDIKRERVEELRSGIDRTQEVTSAELASSDIKYTCDGKDLSQADFHIIAVPTPIDKARKPDLRPLYRAIHVLGHQLKKGDIVVIESTVYPGVTEEECGPILEAESRLTCGVDFFLGYSPERINPGDKEHSFTKITKVVSGQTPEVLDIVADVYGSVVTAGVHKAPSIKVAEAAKVIENTQRDLNIALMNELALVFDRIGIDTQDVLDAAGTKWNFLPFKPGLVGGHCIGVDPYYLTYKAEMLGFHPDVILAGRRINDGVGEFIAHKGILELTRAGKSVKGARVAILGLTFKEDCPDLRNSRVIDVIKTFQSFQVELLVHDPIADRGEAYDEYGVDLQAMEAIQNIDLLVIAVAHQPYKQLSGSEVQALLAEEGAVLDVKGIMDRDEFEQAGISLWRL